MSTLRRWVSSRCAVGRVRGVGARRDRGDHVLVEVRPGIVGPVRPAPAVELVGDPTAVLLHLQGLEMIVIVFLYLGKGKQPMYMVFV